MNNSKGFFRTEHTTSKEQEQLNISLYFFRMLDFNEFLETVIDRQGDSRDIYDEILKGFSMFDRSEY